MKPTLKYHHGRFRIQMVAPRCRAIPMYYRQQSGRESTDGEKDSMMRVSAYAKNKSERSAVVKS